MDSKPGGDKLLLLVVGLLTFLGLVMVYSASSIPATANHGESHYFLLRQSIFAAIGIMALLILMRVNYRFFHRPSVFVSILVITGVALVYALFQPPINGARRWIYIALLNITIQPSEFAKLAVLIFTAWYLKTYEDTLNHPRRIGILCCIIAVFAGLIVLGPDFGQMFILCSLAFILLLLAKLEWRYIVGAISLATLLLYFFVYRVSYRWDRILVFLPWRKGDSGPSSWQIDQSLIAVGSGGYGGLGLGKGKQKLFFLPEASTDFIYAVICEELGFIFATLVVVAFLIYFYCGIKIALNSRDKFGLYLGVGITLMVTLQGLINISMVLDMLPTKGIALPFMSRGGSSLLMNLAATGILLSIAHQNNHTEGPIKAG